MKTCVMGALGGLVVACAVTLVAAPPGNAPNDATYLTLTSNSGLTAERVISATGTPLTFGSEVVFTHARPLSFPNEEGTPGDGTVNMIRVGGMTDADLFLSVDDGPPGTDDHTQGRMLITYARPATAALPVSGASNVLAGWFHDGTSLRQRGIELENKVQTNGTAQFWIEELTEAGGAPFIKFWRTADTSGIVVPNSNPGDKVELAAIDRETELPAVFATLTSDSTPSFVVAPPSGGTVTLRATTFKSSDGSTGATVTNCTSFKNGLCVTGF